MSDRSQTAEHFVKTWEQLGQETLTLRIFVDGMRAGPSGPANTLDSIRRRIDDRNQELLRHFNTIDAAYEKLMKESVQVYEENARLRQEIQTLKTRAKKKQLPKRAPKRAKGSPAGTKT